MIHLRKGYSIYEMHVQNSHFNSVQTILKNNLRGQRGYFIRSWILKKITKTQLNIQSHPPLHSTLHSTCTGHNSQFVQTSILHSLQTYPNSNYGNQIELHTNQQVQLSHLINCISPQCRQESILRTDSNLKCTSSLFFTRAMLSLRRP